MICTKCNKYVAGESYFCPYCGEALDAITAGQTVYPSVAQASFQPAYQPMTQASFQPAYQPTTQASFQPAYQPSAQPEKIKSKKRTRVLIIVGAAVALLIVLAVVLVVTNCFGLLNQPNSNPSNNSGNSSSRTTSQPGLPALVSAYGNTYTVSSVDVFTDEENNTIVRLNGSGFDRLPIRNGEMKIPVSLYVVENGKQLSDWTVVSFNSSGAEFKYEKIMSPETVVFFPADNKSDIHTVKLR